MPPFRVIVAALAAGLSVGASLVGCGSEQGYRGVTFVNQTGVRVDVVEILNGTEVGVVTLDAGKSWDGNGFHVVSSSGDTCTTTTLVARDQQRVEVARHEGRICLDDTWLIGGHPSPPSPILPILVVASAVAAATALILVRRAWLRVSAGPPPKAGP